MKKLFSCVKKLQDLSHDIVPLISTLSNRHHPPTTPLPILTNLIFCVELVIQRRLHAKDVNR